MFWFVLVRVTSWIVLSFLDKRNDPRASHELTRNSLPPKSTFEAKLLRSVPQRGSVWLGQVVVNLYVPSKDIRYRVMVLTSIPFNSNLDDSK